MSWFEPPPLIEKPLPPGALLPKPPRYKMTYLLGLLLWQIGMQVIWFLLLIGRYLLNHPVSFLPSRIWFYELLIVALALLLGNWAMTKILLAAMIIGTRSHDEKKSSTDRD